MSSNKSATPPADKIRCYCGQDGRPCAKACGLTLTTHYCEVEFPQESASALYQQDEQGFLVRREPPKAEQLTPEKIVEKTLSLLADAQEVSPAKKVDLLYALSVMVSDGAVLRRALMKGCRCMSCHVYQIELDDQTFEAESLIDCIEKAIATS